jgi:protein subunit release factor A
MGQDFNKVEAMVTELDELEAKLSDPSTHSNPNEARRIGKRHAELKACCREIPRMDSASR